MNREGNEKDILNGLYCTMQHSMYINIEEQVEEYVQGRKSTRDIRVN